MPYIQYGQHRIEYQLDYAARKTLGIKVTPQQAVHVTAPEQATQEKIEQKLRKRASWILRQIDYFQQFPEQQVARQYISGETHRYLGRQYRLKVSDAETTKVLLKGGYIYLSVTDTSDTEAKRKALHTWYRKRTEVKLPEYFQACLRRFRAYDLPEPHLELKRMAKRWGSCTSQGKIILNPDLVRAPKPSIEYVVIHELCHLIIPNHNQRFYVLLTRIMPDWERWKMELERKMLE